MPFLMSGPALPAAQRSELPVSSLDLPPTLLHLAGVAVPTAWPGRNLLAALEGRQPLTEAFSEWSDDVSPKFRGLTFRAVRTPKHKLIRWQDPAKGEELYDLVADPAEARNLVTDPAAAEILRELRGRLEAWMRSLEDPALAWPRP